MMPLFQLKKGKLSPVAQANFITEKNLQALVEGNLGIVFNCRLVATEYATGAQHAGRIDTLALSEDNNPVIIEYKKAESADLINQSLFYLSWLSDHHGDFELAAQRALGFKTEVDWSAIRVICIAPNYKKYDLHAVQMMGANIELWTYRSSRTIHIISRRSSSAQWPPALMEWRMAHFPLGRKQPSRGRRGLTTSTSI
jgi:hypothetical protein